MAEETVVKEPLTREMLDAGRSLLLHFDETGFEVVAALWLFYPDANEWRLVLATPEAETNGPKKVYEKVQEALKNFPQFKGLLELRNTAVVRPEDRFIKLLRSAIRTGPGIHGIRFSRNIVNDVLVEDAYVYRAA